MIKIIFGILIALIVTVIALPAAATKTSEEESGYGYSFDDDPIAAGGWGANDMTIKVRPKAARVTLIRPRTSFVMEMIKSIENL